MPPSIGPRLHREEVLKVLKKADIDPSSGPKFVDLFFADDSRQNTPSRKGMNPLVATGGFSLPAEAVFEANQELDKLCDSQKFPIGSEFKWSPGRELWMRNKLVGDARREFFLKVLEILLKYDACATVIISDTSCSPATKAEGSETDVTNMFIERVEHHCRINHIAGLIIVDRPTGDRREEDKFLAKCIETIQTGTDYVKPEHIAHNVVSTPSKLSRLLQCADLIVGCSLARVAGEKEYAPPIFNAIKPLLSRTGVTIGGVGLKIHPTFKYANLYHWLVGDELFWRNFYDSRPFPLSGYPYSITEDQP